GLRTLGAAVTVCGPTALVPCGIESLGCTVAPTVEDALAGADAAMALRIQHERMDEGLAPAAAEYTRAYGLDEARVSLMNPAAVVLHPGPLNRGIEIENAVADGPRSRILAQVENGVSVRCAVLSRCARALRS